MVLWAQDHLGKKPKMKQKWDLNVERWLYHNRRVDNSDIEKVYLIKKDKSKVGHPPSFQ